MNVRGTKVLRCIFFVCWFVILLIRCCFSSEFPDAEKSTQDFLMITRFPAKPIRYSLCCCSDVFMVDDAHSYREFLK